LRLLVLLLLGCLISYSADTLATYPTLFYVTEEAASASFEFDSGKSKGVRSGSVDPSKTYKYIRDSSGWKKTGDELVISCPTEFACYFEESADELRVYIHKSSSTFRFLSFLGSGDGILDMTIEQGTCTELEL